MHTRKKGLPYVRQSLCKSFMDLWYKGLSNVTNTFIHSFIHNQISRAPTRHYMGMQRWTNADPALGEHTMVGCWGVGVRQAWEYEIPGRQAGRQTRVSCMRCFETHAWRNQSKLPRGGGVGLSHEEESHGGGHSRLKLALGVFATARHLNESLPYIRRCFTF